MKRRASLKKGEKKHTVGTMLQPRHIRGLFHFEERSSNQICTWQGAAEAEVRNALQKKAKQKKKKWRIENDVLHHIRPLSFEASVHPSLSVSLATIKNALLLFFNKQKTANARSYDNSCSKTLKQCKPTIGKQGQRLKVKDSVRRHKKKKRKKWDK